MITKQTHRICLIVFFKKREIWICVSDQYLCLLWYRIGNGNIIFRDRISCTFLLCTNLLHFHISIRHPSSSAFLLFQISTSHQPAYNIFLSQQISISYQTQPAAQIEATVRKRMVQITSAAWLHIEAMEENGHLVYIHWPCLDQELELFELELIS